MAIKLYICQKVKDFSAYGSTIKIALLMQNA